MRRTPSRLRVSFELTDGTIFRPFETYGIKLSEWEISPPRPRVERVQIEGASGSLDLTEWLGYVAYDDRKVELTFKAYNATDFSPFYALTGQRVKLRFNTMPDLYFDGRIDTMQVKDNGFQTIFALSLTCDPFRLRERETTITQTLTTASTDYEITLQTEMRPAFPVLTASADMTITVGDDAVECSAGTFELANLFLTSEPQTITANSATAGATLTIKWRDGVI